ncbi:flavin reductase [Nocardioides marmorisolisilvae]|uniref:Flavin reductase n=2 Tax=Nocardioides marmorisolisilvae TaxID=1542737 RepID=A0A3N0DV91_9ACTN|nr:flavin reductase [Nocardioides marmorisolisilvae]
MNPDARATWPSQELVQSWLGNELDFELRLGEHTPIPDDPEAAAQARKFRDVLGLFCSGVTVVTSVSEGKPVGMTCQSFSSVSLEPPLIMFSPAKTSRAWPLIRRAGYFCVNILAADQSELSNGMATKGEEKFDGVAWTTATTGAPVIEGVLGYIDCQVQQVVEAGDHYIVVGLVKELSFGDRSGGSKVDPLLFFQGKYTQPQ